MLGSGGICHERTGRRYSDFQGIGDCWIELITDFFVGLEMIRGATTDLPGGAGNTHVCSRPKVPPPLKSETGISGNRRS